MSITQYNNIFYTVKEVSFPQVQKTFHGKEPKKNKINCPFHGEKTPSLHIYPDGFKCFGCGESGDSVDFVAKLYNMRPLEAALLIAEKFGIPTDQGKAPSRLSKEVLEAQRERVLKKALKAREREAFLKLADLCDWIREIFRNEGLNVNNNMAYLVHRLPMFEYWTEILTTGTDKEKAELLQSKDLRRWLHG